MPWLELAIASIIANASAVTAYEQNKKNVNEQKMRNFQDELRQDRNSLFEARQAREDSERLNTYNSPIQQMNRLRQAGLNPNLVYGKGADNTAPMARGFQTNTTDKRSPHYDFEGIAHAGTNFLNSMQTQAQTDNLYAQKELMAKEGTLKDANVAKILQDTARSKWDWEQADRVKDQVVEKATLENDTLKQNLTLNLNANDRAEMSNSANVALTLTKIVTEKLSQGKTTAETQQIREIIQSIELDQKIKELDIELRKKNIMPHDPAYSRYMQNLINGAINTIPQIQWMHRYGEGGKMKYDSTQNKNFNQWNKQRKTR